jgi:hypothetical protein
MLEVRPSTASEAIRTAFSLYAEAQSKTRYGDKTPTYVFHLPMLAGAFPEARFVHVVRDGRDVALSLIDASFGPDNMREAAAYWRRHVEAGRAAGRMLGDRYLEIRYEELVTEPGSVLREVCALSEVPLNDGMFDFAGRAEQLRRGLNPMNHANLHRPVRPYRNWRYEMSPADVDAFEGVAGHTLEAFGYPLSGDAVPRVPQSLTTGPLKRRLRARVRSLGRIAPKYVAIRAANARPSAALGLARGR